MVMGTLGQSVRLAAGSPHHSVWKGENRPTPAELGTDAYDRESDSPPRHKILVCAGPRTSSKRLGRLLLAAGLGVPMEYLNPRSVAALTARWRCRTRDYLASIYRWRTANGVFSSNLQYGQIRAWRHKRDIDDLFDGATVIHLSRRSKVAQAASLAACMLTGNYGFVEETPPPSFSEWRLRKAARQAVRLIAEEDRGWSRVFEERQIDPIGLTDDRVNADTPELVEAIASRVGIPFDSSSLRRMLVLDDGPYATQKDLKSRLRLVVLDYLEMK